MTTEKQTPDDLAAECKRLREALCAVYFRQGQQFNHSSMSEAVQLIRQHDAAIDQLAALAPATAKQPAEPREHILSAHIALSTCDGEGRVDKHHVQIAHEHIEAALGCLAATAPAPQAREITDAEIDALFPDGLSFEDSDWGKISHDELRRIVRAAIALANKKD